MKRDALDSQAMTLDDTTIFENAREAVITLKKTFDTWVVIGRAVVRAREIADRRGGGGTFKRLIAEQGLAPIVNPATASRLERIMERLPDVIRWHETLTPRQQIDWAAPTTIYKRCPVFLTPKPKDDEDEEKPVSKAKQTEQALAVALEEIEQLKRQKEDERFTPTDTAEDVATTIVAMYTPRKAQEIAKLILAKVKERTAKAPKDEARATA